MMKMRRFSYCSSTLKFFSLLQAGTENSYAVKVLTGKTKTKKADTLNQCKCVNQNGATKTELGLANQQWLTPQQDDTEYGKVYKRKYGGVADYGEFCAAWEDTETEVKGATTAKGAFGVYSPCMVANATAMDDRPKWCSKPWCYVKIDDDTVSPAVQTANGKVAVNSLDSNAGGAPDGPGCTGLSDVTKSKMQDQYIWYSYQICE
ncbi:unnamed protein product [Amoebophrya sp. A120]|nr:unnamed protein product [Amoebophrya sp. A120]|eukprot:GSA120T00013509001.1